MKNAAGRKVRQRVPGRMALAGLVAQAVSVVFAVLVALAIDEAWESREDAQLGRDGVAAIRAEVRSNLEALEQRRPKTDSVLLQVDSAMRAIRAGAAADEMHVSIDYPIALLSSAAWQTAQVTRAVNFMDIELVIRIAQAYDLQTFFLRNQERLTDMIADMSTSVGSDPERMIGEVGNRYRLVTGFRDALITEYRCMLVELDGSEEDVTDCAREQRDDTPLPL